MKRSRVILLCTFLMLGSILVGCGAGSAVDSEATIQAGVQVTLTAEAERTIGLETEVAVAVEETLTAQAPQDLIVEPTSTLVPPDTPAPTVPPENTPLTTDTPVSTVPTTPSDTPTSSSELQILDPSDGATTNGRRIRVSGEGGQPAYQSDAIFLNIVVLPPDGSMWVQERPRIQEDGTWESSEVLIGRSGNVDVGEVFEICAIFGSSQLPLGEIFDWPEGASACIGVVRG